MFPSTQFSVHLQSALSFGFTFIASSLRVCVFGNASEFQLRFAHFPRQLPRERPTTMQGTMTARAAPPAVGYRRSESCGSARLAPPGSWPKAALPCRKPQQPRHSRRRQLPGAAALLSPSAAFDVATVLVMPFYLAMIAAPKKQFTQQLLGSGPVLAAGAALYGVLLAAWNPLPQLAAVVRAAAASVGAAAASGGADALRASLPSMPAFAALFTASEVTVVAWVHLLLLDLLQARWVYNDGLRNSIPTGHSAVLCFMVGPLGLLCHLATKAAVLAWRGRGRKEEYVVYRF